jgi:hypothetical protein
MIDMKEQERYTLEMFMEDYKGFDWNETVVMIKRSTGQPFICVDQWQLLLRKYKDAPVWAWSHIDKIMAITLDI